MRNHRSYSGRGRRRGQVFIYMALGMGVWFSCAAIVIDLGWRNYRKAMAQRAADASALAGVAMLPDLSATTGAEAQARYYAGLNGFPSNDSRVTITLSAYPDSNMNRYKVRVARREPSFFAGYFTKNQAVIGASATAEYVSKAPIDITGGGTYGSSSNKVNLSVFGPDAYYNNGDPFDPQYLPKSSSNHAQDTSKPNPQNSGWKGYDYGFTIPSNYSSKFGTNKCTLEVFDPDCYNVNNAQSPDGDNTYDELRDSSGNGVSDSNHGTDTRYSLYWDNNTPNDLSDDVLIGQNDYDAQSRTWDMKWDQMFTWDTSQYTTGSYRMNVLPTDGSSENGFNLRAGPPHSSSMSESSWSSNYGTKSEIPKITATGNLEENFNSSGTVTMTLGYVAAEAAGGSLYINKFDTDVGAKSIVYKCDSLPGRTFSGTLAADGTWKLDTISLPSDYTGGTWSATYAAGSQDTSVWTMNYSNYVPGVPGVIRLVE